MRADRERYRAQLGDATGAAEVGALLSELFAEDRDRLHKIIDDRVRLLGERGLPLPANAPEALPLVPASVPPPPPEDAKRPEVIPPLPSLAPSAMWIPEHAPPRRRGWVAAVLLVAAAAVALGMWRGEALERVAAIWPGLFPGATAAGRAPTIASATDVGPQLARPREEHVPLAAESTVPVHEAAPVPPASAMPPRAAPAAPAAPAGASKGDATPSPQSAPAASTKGETFPFGRL
jgi:hypothetical protein